MTADGAAFVRLWSATTVSTFGSAITTVVLPLVAVLMLDAGAVEVGLIAAAGESAWLLIGLPAGVWVHRLPLRTTLVLSDLVRAVTLGLVVLGLAFDVLTLPGLLAAAFVMSAATVLFDIGFASYLTTVVPPARLAVGNSVLQGSESVAQVGGPALGGGLVTLLGGAATLFADVVSYVVSALTLLTLPDPPDLRPPETPLLQQVRIGLRYVRRQPVIARTTLCAALTNVAGMAIQTLSGLFLLRTVGVGPAMVGLLLSSAGVGGLAGSVLAPVLAARWGTARTVVLSLLVIPAGGLVLPLTTAAPAGLALFFAGNALLAGGLVVFGILTRTYRQMVVPFPLLSRVNATCRFVTWGVLPLGGLAAGVLGQALGPRGALAACGVGLLLAPLPVLAGGPIRARRDLPTGLRVSLG